jgi:F420-dependent NADP oxidoreductase-like protein
MKVGVLGSGTVGQTLGAGFLKHAHQVMLGTRDPKKPDVQKWVQDTPGAAAGTFEETAKFGELIVLATLGRVVENVIDLAGANNFTAKPVIDATNPLADHPPVDGVLQFTTGPNESLAEKIQQCLGKRNWLTRLASLSLCSSVQDQVLQQRQEMRTQSAEFLAMGSREFLENLGSSTAEFHKDFAAVLEIVLPFNQFLGGETVNQFDGCMMNDLELLCQFTDGYTFSLRETFDGKQCLILARSQTSGLSGFFTELKESPKTIAEFCEQSVLGFSQARRNSSGGSGHSIVRIRLSSACSSKRYVPMRYIFAVVVPMRNSCSPHMFIAASRSASPADA